MNNNNNRGHVFIIYGGLPKISCDSWLFPTNVAVEIDKLCKWTGTKESEILEHQVINIPKDWSENACRVFKVDNWHRVKPYSPRPWIGLTGQRKGQSATLEWYIEALKQYLESVSLDLKNSVPRNKREKHLVAVPLVGAGEGGAKTISGEILDAVIKELFRTVRTYNIDVALVTNQKQVYAAALSVRGSYQDAFACLDSRLLEEGDNLIKYAAKNKLVVFIGAGCSAAAGIPTWGQLLDHVADEAGVTEEEKNFAEQLPYIDRADFYERRLRQSGQSLQALISTRMNQDVYSVSHAMLATLPVNEYVTTNYDRLFELANEAVGEKIRVLPYDTEEPLNTKTLAGKWILKLHGCINHQDDIVLTREHYLSYNERKQALAGIVQALLITRHMLFVGFSLSDDHFFNIASTVRKAMSHHANRVQPFGTALSLVENPVVSELWKNDVRMTYLSKNSVQQGARVLEILLDYVCSRSVSSIKHIFDPEYNYVLSKGDQKFRNSLLQFIEESEKDPAIRNSHSFAGFKRAVINAYGNDQIFESSKRKRIIGSLESN